MWKVNRWYLSIKLEVVGCAGLEYRDVGRCASCGGKCCKLYIQRCEGGQLPDDIHYANDNIVDLTQNFEYYFQHSVWYLEKDKFEVEPLYDVLKAFSAWIDSYIYNDFSARKIEALRFLSELKERGISMGYCAYWTKRSGCIIAWEKRPIICKEHRCKEWLEEDNKQKLKIRS